MLLRQNLTYDRDNEMPCHAKLAKRLDLAIGSADLYVPRQYWPQQLEFGMLIHDLLRWIETRINTRPQKNLDSTLPGDCTEEVFKPIAR